MKTQNTAFVETFNPYRSLIMKRSLPTLTAIGFAVSALLMAGSTQAAIVLTADAASQNNNLTTLGTLDWVNLNNTGRNEKAGASFIGDVTLDDNGRNTTLIQSGTSSTYISTWTDGTPTASATDSGHWEAKDTTTGTAPGGFAFSVSGLATGQYTMTVYATKYRTTADFTATIGGESQTVSFNTNGNDAVTDITEFNLEFDITAGQTLDISYLMTGDQRSNNNVGIGAITLAPEPTSLSMLGLGGLCLMCRRRV